MSMSDIYNIGSLQRSAGASYYQPQAIRKVEFQPREVKYQPRETSTEDMETALAYLNGDLNTALKIQRPKQAENPNPYNKQTENFENRGEAWKGFSIPPNNTTGELNPFSEHNIAWA